MLVRPVSLSSELTIESLFLSRGADGTVERNQCTQRWPACCHYLNKHTHRVINKQTHMPIPPGFVQGTMQKTHTHNEHKCYIFTSDLINTEGPKMFGQLSTNSWSGQLIDDPTELFRFRLKRYSNTKTANKAAAQTVKSANSLSELHLAIILSKQICWCFVIPYHKAENKV